MATSASPVQSTTALARISWRPLLDSVTTPRRRLPSITTSTAIVCSSGRTPLSSTSLSAIILNSSVSRLLLELNGNLCVAPSICARVSISRAMPVTSLLTPSYRYHPSVSIPHSVMVPPKHPYRSITITSAPARAALMAALSPAGPAPTTSTSHSASTGITRGGST